MKRVGPALKALLKELSEGVCVSSPEGRLIYLNPAAERILNLRLDRVRGKLLCELLCGHLETRDGPECASKCALRDPQRPEQTVDFDGEFGRAPAFVWRWFNVKRCEGGKRVNVHCLRVPGNHFTLVREVPAEPERTDDL